MIHQVHGGEQGQPADIEILAKEILLVDALLNGYMGDFAVAITIHRYGQPAHHSARKGFLRDPLSFINRSDAEVSTIFVSARKNLSSHEGNYDLLRSEDDLIEGLRNFVKSGTNRVVHQEAFDILEELTDADDDMEMEELDELENEAGLREKEEALEPGLLKEPITVRLKIPGVSDEVLCVRVEQLLVRKSGVISVVFEIGAEVAVVYTRLPASDLAHFLTTMTGSNVEVLPEVQEEDSDKENAEEQPGYLDKTGQRLRDLTKKSTKKHTISQGASSLHERLRVQREEESRRKARANRLMNSIGRGINSGWGLW